MPGHRLFQAHLWCLSLVHQPGHQLHGVAVERRPELLYDYDLVMLSRVPHDGKDADGCKGKAGKSHCIRR